MVLGAALTAAGCQTCMPGTPCCDAPVPRELDKTSLPPYTLEPPDIILIDALRLIPKPPYHIEPLDGLLIQVTNAPKEPIEGIFSVDPDGTVNLGVSYGSVRVADLTIEEARKAIHDHLELIYKGPVVQVSLAQSSGMQLIKGQHLVRPDGTVGLGAYGSVYVAGMTLDEARATIEAHLAQYLLKPQVSVDVFAYNSKAYYVITDGGGFGEQVNRLPCTGNETVLDAISQIYGLPAVASKGRIWLTRPLPASMGCAEQTLPVDWTGITRRGNTGTNYQVLPGDRIYVQADPLITVDTYLARVISPIERVLGVTLLGSSTVHSIQNKNGTGGTGGF
jgi:polysaccharide export outer membrane protein